MKQQHEFKIQQAVSQFLRVQYPNVKFLSDTVASVKLTKAQAARNKSIQCNAFKCPDLIILYPNEKYKGLFIELKAKPITKKNNDELLKNEHVEQQQKTIDKLNELGYFASFAIGFSQAVEIIENYMNNKI